MVYNEYKALNKLINCLAGVFAQFDSLKLPNYAKYGLFLCSLERTLADVDLERNFIPSLKTMEVQDFHKILKAKNNQRRFYIYLWVKGVRL